ncbi:MAG: dTDP-4-dehydrorhamnose reductase [Verrucomicrobiota bacterium]|nr:dTDP-4-dehydrorhamnose reductase [Verrucomicrobiota bacterium]
MKRLVVVGAAGRLGAALCRSYAADFGVVGLGRNEIDLFSEDQIRAALDPLSFDLLINCAALTNVDYCETHAEEAHRINGDAVKTLAEICREKSARLIHTSTDYVFDGETTKPYREDDAANPVNVYGESKRAGEIAALGVSSENLVARVSWVFGPDRPSFVDAILKKSLETESVEAIDDKFSAPAFTLDLAKSFRSLMLKPNEGGVMHVCNSGECSWREYGQFAIDCAVKAGLPVKARTVAGVKMSQMASFVARRPRYTVLSTVRLEGVGEKPRPWQSAVQDYVTNYFAPRSRA